MLYAANQNIRAMVWEVTPKDKYCDVKLSTSEKKTDGSYINSNWIARAFGSAYELLKDVHPKTPITIHSFKLSNEPYKDKTGATKSSLQFIIFEASLRTDKKKESAPKTTKAEPTNEDPWTEALPF